MSLVVTLQSIRHLTTSEAYFFKSEECSHISIGIELVCFLL